MPAHNPDFKGEKMKKKAVKKGTPRAKKPSGRRSAPSKKDGVIANKHPDPSWKSIPLPAGFRLVKSGKMREGDKMTWGNMIHTGWNKALPGWVIEWPRQVVIREVQPKSPKSPKGRGK